jgi:hypothetical protein
MKCIATFSMICPQLFLLKLQLIQNPYPRSYFDGKKKAEMAVQNTFKDKGYVLRPGMIYGTRVVPLPDFMASVAGPTMSIPLGFLGRYHICFRLTLASQIRYCMTTLLIN